MEPPEDTNAVAAPERDPSSLRPFRIHEPLAIIGKSSRAEAIREFIRMHAAAVSAKILITGKTGTGKELLARHLHFQSPRRIGPFIAINCSAIADGLVESQLFGHVRGAFTGADRQKKGYFAMAHRGTLFLDEVGELPLDIQAKLLRALEEGLILPVGAEVPTMTDVRIIAATNRDLDARVLEGLFRQDLLFRLRTAEITLPELRERISDVPELSEAFLSMAAGRYGKQRRKLSPESLLRLLEYSWPGNIRELEHEVERLTLVGKEVLILPEELHSRITKVEPPPRRSIAPESEPDKILRLLDEHGGAREAVARSLGIGRSTLWRKMREYGITRTFGRSDS